MTTTSEIHETVRAHWNLDGPVPTMRPGWWRCGACGDQRFRYRFWSFFEYQAEAKHRVPHRCNLEIVCAGCWARTRFGIPIPAGYYEENWSHGGNRIEVVARTRVISEVFAALLIGPDLAADAPLTSGSFWTLELERPYPTPAVSCGECGARPLHPRNWSYHRNEQGLAVCDVGTKCYACSATRIFEVPVPDSYYKENQGRGGSRVDVETDDG